jgi:ethanolamine utilization cobalamin adenosyltransferase
MGHPLTEQDIRQLLKKDESLRSLVVPKGTLVTPSALEFIKMSSITLEYTESCDEATETARPTGYLGLHGEQLDTKPEELTHLYGNQLTEKDNPIIAFRGKLDKLCALILEAQSLGEEKGSRAFINDMQEVLDFVRSLLPAEYKCGPLGDFTILGYSSKDLRERSHNPEKFFGRKHLLMHYSMGALCLRLNLLRTVVREAELAAVATLREPSACAAARAAENASPQNSPPAHTRCHREDIVEALNRLSSLFYILIYKYLPKNYNPAGSAGI